MAELDGFELSAPLIQRETGPISLNLLSPQGVTTQGARQGAFETHKGCPRSGNHRFESGPRVTASRR
jgi:hypothetical protein